MAVHNLYSISNKKKKYKICLIVVNDFGCIFQWLLRFMLNLILLLWNLYFEQNYFSNKNILKAKFFLLELF